MSKDRFGKTFITGGSVTLDRDGKPSYLVGRHGRINRIADKRINITFYDIAQQEGETRWIAKNDLLVGDRYVLPAELKMSFQVLQHVLAQGVSQRTISLTQKQELTELFHKAMEAVYALDLRTADDTQPL